MRLTTLVLASLIVNDGALAYPRSDMPSATFTYKDWELACDNTRTCRAAGYQAQGSKTRASLLLQRAAGPGQKVRAELQLADKRDVAEIPENVIMSAAGVPAGRVKLDRRTRRGYLSSQQTAFLLQALAGSGDVVWSGAGRRWTVSTAGATAVLLKMDEFQGRLDTVDALVRKGKHAATTVLPPLPAPVIRQAPVVDDTSKPAFTAEQQATLLKELRRTASGQDCDGIAASDAAPERLTIQRLTEAKFLIGYRCWTGAYNQGIGYWVVDARPPYAAVFVTNKASTYTQGKIESVQLGRGIGDCEARSTWTWDGKSFALTSESTTGMCREIRSGGAWLLPTIVTKIRGPAD